MKKGILVFAAGVTALSYGQDKKDPIVTDRPDFTESAVVVPLKSIQVEMGMTYQWNRQGHSLGLPETLFRISNGNRSEFRIGIPDYNWQNTSGQHTAGFGDTYLGAKFQIGPLKNGDDFAVIPAVNLPSHNSAFSSGTIDPEVKLCWGRELNPSWGVSAMVYELFVEGRYTVTETTVSFGHELTDRSGMFIEYAGIFDRQSQSNHILHLGWAYRPTPNNQFDIHGGLRVGTSDAEPFLAMGYSVRY